MGLVAVGVALLALLASGATWIAFGARHDHRVQHGQPQREDPAAAPGPKAPETSPQASLGDQQQGKAVAADLAGLRTVRVPPAPARPIARIPTAYRHQPDLYARAFVQHLLAQDYATPRDDHLAWVQADSATTDEPLVTGMVPPELRDKLALFSVTDHRSGPAPIPDAAEWKHLAEQHGHVTVTVRRVTEPLAWSNAVEAGRVTDPGVTAREVTAAVTLTTRAGGRTVIRNTSVDVTLNLVGPPTRPDWAFATLITYRAVPMGATS